MAKEFEYFEVVVMGSTERTVGLGIERDDGVVVGVSKDEVSDSKWYTVIVESIGEAVMLESGDFSGTGKRVDAGAVYDGSALQVDSEGEIVGFTEPT